LKALAVFFDRDDTLIKNVPYLGDPAQVELLPGVSRAMEKLSEWGFALFIVSNQSGVGRGLITPQQVEAVNAEMVRQIGRNYFKQIYNCYEEPEQSGVYQRKPSPYFLYQAAREYGLDLAKSYFVGDRLADILAGRNAGSRTILVLSGHQVKERPLSSLLADDVVEGLAEAVKVIERGFSPDFSGFGGETRNEQP
jgi:D-glycero-D-manno-heptose 1,7-bisphosphate phosphatase